MFYKQTTVLKIRDREENMVKVTFHLSEFEIEILSKYLESAIDIKQINEHDKKTAKIILEQLNKYL